MNKLIEDGLSFDTFCHRQQPLTNNDQKYEKDANKKCHICYDMSNNCVLILYVSLV